MRGVSILIGLIATIGTPVLAAPTETVLYSFQVADAYPRAGLIRDAAGNLYTTTVSGGLPGCGGVRCGTIVKLTPPVAGQSSWTETTLYRFQGRTDGYWPLAGLIADRMGNLYTTTNVGGGTGCGSGCGTIVRLSPPAAGALDWTETVLYRFQGGTDGWSPQGGLIADGKGNLYTTTNLGGTGCGNGCGTIVKLSPPAAGSSNWTETVLYRFQGGTDGDGPQAGLIADGKGGFYTTTNGGGGGYGTIVKLSRPATGVSNWTETVLYRFKGGLDGAFLHAGLIADGIGDLYTTTNSGGTVTGCSAGCGTVVKLTHPATGQSIWTETVLLRFRGGTDLSNPTAGLIADSTGNLYTTATAGGGAGCGGNGCGGIVKLSPPGVGATHWKETILYRFKGGTDGSVPVAGLIADRRGDLYTTTAIGGGSGCTLQGCGTLIELSGAGFD